jgi:SAM-dependent methyltransferase
MWNSITGAKAGEMAGKTAVEFGCGPGRFLDLVRSGGGRAVGIDLSRAVDAARRNFADDPDVLIVQGDVLRPPFREGVFDCGFTIGVLHHTPDPLRGVKQLARTVKPGGWIACSVYPRRGFYSYRSVDRFRRFQNLLRPVIGHTSAIAYSYFSAYVLAPLMTRGRKVRRLARLLDTMERNWLVVLKIPDARWRVLDTFDAITPAIATTHSSDEVRAWMENAGCTLVRPTGWGGTSMAGVKGAALAGSESLPEESGRCPRRYAIPASAVPSQGFLHHRSSGPRRAEV